MSSHDEYSSDEESISQPTDVYLGFLDEEIDETPSIEDTFIGGQPVWLHPELKPDARSYTCDSCGKTMALYLQAFAPIDGKLYDRVIYIFGCKNTALCSRKKGTIKAIRGISKDPKRVAQIKQEQEEEERKQLDEVLQRETQKKLQVELTKDLFGGGAAANPFANPFAKPAEPAPPAEPVQKKTEQEKKVESYAEVAKAAAPKKANKAAVDTQFPSYKGYFVYVEPEKFKKITQEPELEKYKHLIDQDNDDEPPRKERTMSSSSSVNPQTKRIANMLDDKYFGNFTAVVNHNPSQVLRYDLGGRPLLYNGKDEIAQKLSGELNIPNPGYNPSSSRQFELQLMPQAIMILEDLGDNAGIADIINGMSWGTIIVCTDVEDYAPVDEHHVGYVEEYCAVQWEELV